MKRFYKLVSKHQEPAGISIRLDGRDVKTPAGAILRTHHVKLAEAIAGEWIAQGESIIPNSMPLTQILSTRIDRIGSMREEISRQSLNYLDTDLLCYRAEVPPGVPELQAKFWDPWLNWFSQRFGAELQTTTNIAALKQPETAHKAVQKYVQALDDDRFTILQLITSASGSLILALAFIEGKIDAEGIFAAAHVEENFKAALYNETLHGPDPAQEKKQKSLRIDLAGAQEYLQLLKIK